jgi:hypothetical protein
MSASTQTGQTNNPTPGNGSVRGKPGRKPAIKAAAPQGQQPGPTGAPSQANVAERRIGPAVPPLPFTSSFSWLQTREIELSIELRVIRSMIAQFGPRRAAAAPKKAKSKKAKKAPVRQAA